MLNQDLAPTLQLPQNIKSREQKPLSGMVSNNSKLRFFDNSTLDTYRVCPRKFYFRHVRNFETTGTRPPLIFGSAIHSAMDAIWAGAKTYNDKELLELAIFAFLKVWKENKMEELEEFDLFPRTPGRALSILEAYIERYGHFLRDIELIAIESPFIVPLNLDDETVGYVGKLDKIFKDRYGIQIVDHKTASSMSTSWTNSFSPNGQMDGYLHAGHTTYGEEFHGVIIDGILVNKTKIDFMRIPLQRQSSQLDAWSWEVSNLIDQIELNEEWLTEYLESGERLTYLPAFPKCTTSCTQYFGTCPYLDLCKFWDNPAHHACPDNFEEKKWEPFTILEQLDGSIKVIENVKE